MTRNEILEVAGQFYTPETITEREIAFARHMMKYEREACARVCEDSVEYVGDTLADAIRARGKQA
jgi:hypothetical protein